MYVHVPAEHEPNPEYTVRVLAFAHVFAGGVVHETPAHGSLLHSPSPQPAGQAIELEVYTQLPLDSQVPFGEYTVSVLEVAHTLAGGERQLTHLGPRFRPERNASGEV